MAKKRYYASEYYAGMDSRRRLEAQDSMMIREDKSATANLPQNVIMKHYPKGSYGGMYNLNDTMRGIDKQMSDDGREKKKMAYPEKY